MLSIIDNPIFALMSIVSIVIAPCLYHKMAVINAYECIFWNVSSYFWNVEAKYLASSTTYFVYNLYLVSLRTDGITGKSSVQINKVALASSYDPAFTRRRSSLGRRSKKGLSAEPPAASRTSLRTSHRRLRSARVDALLEKHKSRWTLAQRAPAEVRPVLIMKGLIS